MLNRGGQQQYYKYAFIIFIAAYLGSIIIYSRYTFNLDDIWMWLNIYNKDLILNGYVPHQGRFFPLASLDLNILMQFSKSPYLFFSFNALVAGSIIILYYKLLNEINLSSRIRMLVISLFILGIGFVTVIFGICYPERLLSLSILIFVFCSVLVTKNNNFKACIIGLLALNISLYLKEPVFISAFAFGVILIYGGFRDKNKLLKIYGSLICISSVIYISLYFTFIYGEIVKRYDQTVIFDVFLIKLRGFIHYLLNDSFIAFLLSAILFYRIYLILKKKEEINILFDGLLIAAFLYFIAFLVLNLYSNYYLLPSYMMGGVAMMYYLINKNYIRFFYLKAISIICGILFITMSIPSGIHNIVGFKSNGVQFQDTLAFISSYINNSSKKVNIYFDGIGRGVDKYGEYYPSYFAQYLNTIYKVDNFDILSKEPNGRQINIDSNSKIAYKNTSEIQEPKKGDLLIVTNVSNNFNGPSYMKELKNKYTLIYKTNSFNIPYISVKSLSKYFLKQNNMYLKIFNNENIFKLPLNTYVFEI